MSVVTPKAIARYSHTSLLQLGGGGGASVPAGGPRLRKRLLYNRAALLRRHHMSPCSRTHRARSAIPRA